MSLHITALLVVVIVLIGLFKLILYPAFFSPLAKIPTAHWSCSISPAWLLWQKWMKRENSQVYDAHMQKGPAIRLGPNLLSINAFDEGLKSIYQGGFPKPEFYWHGFAVYDKPNLFTIQDNATHSAQKRVLSHSFSKSNILSSDSIRLATRDVLYARALPLLRGAAKDGKPIEMIEFNYSCYLDAFVQWQFGRSLRSNLVEDERERRMYLDGFFGVAEYTFFQYNFPRVTSLLRKFGIHLIPRVVMDRFGEVEAWNLQKCDAAHKLLLGGKHSPEDHPCVFEQAMKGMSNIQAEPGEYPNRLELASDMFSLNSGAFETSGNTTTYIFYELSRNPQWQIRLREELQTVSQSFAYNESMVDPRVLDELPILHAVVQETLRRWPSVPGGQPRVVPKTCNLAGYSDIPPGTIVQAYAGTLHRTPEVFQDPWAWKPERWLGADPQHLALMKRWSWGFGSGGRGCLGNHFALYAIKSLVAIVYTNFATEIHACGDMEQTDGYLACPKGQKLELRFHEVKTQRNA